MCILIIVLDIILEFKLIMADLNWWYGLVVVFLLLVHSCSVSLGMEDKRIPDGAVTASSSFDNNHRPSLARLNILSDGKHVGAWCPKEKTINQWLQIDLGEITAVTKVATQGRYSSPDRARTYTLSYSVDGMHWTGYKQRASEKVQLYEMSAVVIILLIK